VRNREHTKQKIVDAAIEIVRSEGFDAAGINAIAARAGVSKVLIYRYFGDLHGVYRAIARALDLTKTSDIVAALTAEASDAEPRPRREAIAAIFYSIHDRLRTDRLTQELLLQELRESNELTDAFAEAQEEEGLEVTEIAARRFADAGYPAANAVDYNAYFAVVSAGIYYMTLRSRTATVFNGIDISDEAGWRRVSNMCADALIALLEPSER
jgi:AcrR family transcriptional regulator